MRNSVCRGIAIISIFLASSATAKGPFGSITYGHWSGGAYIDDNTGGFSSCIASAPYRSGITLSVVVNKQGGWGLGFNHDNWSLQPNATFPIVLTFDGQSPFNVVGRALSNQLVLVPMPNDLALITQFRKSKAMSAFAQGQLFQFKLDATSVILPSLANCVTQMNSKGISYAGDFTVRPPPINPVAATGPNVGGSLKPETSQPVSQELQIEAIELASNFLMKTQLHSAQVVSRADTPVELASYGAAWKSEEAAGFVRIIPTGADVKGLDVAATVIGNDAKACKGKFASGRMSELVDSDVVFRGFATCEDLDGSRVAQYFILPRRKGGFVMFSVQTNMKTEQARDITKEEKLVDFRKAALIAVSK